LIATATAATATATGRLRTPPQLRYYTIIGGRVARKSRFAASAGRDLYQDRKRNFPPSSTTTGFLADVVAAQ